MLLGKAAEDVTGKVTDGLFDRLFSPPAFFWVAPALAWLAVDPVGRFAFAIARLETLKDSQLLALGLAVLALLVLSSAAYEPFGDYVVGALAGTWRGAAFLGTPICEFLWLRQRIRLDRWQTLRALGNDRSLAENQEYDALDRSIKYVPAARALIVPTTFGCALVAASRRIDAKYGLLSQTTWPALSMVIPDASRKMVADAYAAIQDSARLIFWSAAAIGWFTINPIVIPVALVFVVLAYLRLEVQGRDYSDAIEAAFDTGRFALYKALRYPEPINADVEPSYGAQISQYLRRGLDDVPPIPFTTGKSDG